VLHSCHFKLYENLTPLNIVASFKWLKKKWKRKPLQPKELLKSVEYDILRLNVKSNTHVLPIE